MEEIAFIGAVKIGALSGKQREITGAVRIGRHPSNEVSVADPSTSRHHCLIREDFEGYHIEDMLSSNGTYVNGKQVMGRRKLQFGDVIRIGNTRLFFKVAA